MSKNLELKKQVVSDIVKKFQDAQSVIVVKYSGLTVEQVTGLRAQFRANGVEYCVLKNTLVRRALKELNIEGLDEVLNGPSAFAFGMNDPVSPAKIINDFIVKKKSEAIEIKAGLLCTTGSKSRNNLQNRQAHVLFLSKAVRHTVSAAF